MPFLAAALHRWLREFPSTRNGLGLTEQNCLRALDDEPRPAANVFSDLRMDEEAPFHGDSTAYYRIERLTQGPRALVESDTAGEINGNTYVHITETGRQVRDGALDAIRLNGIERWMGGACNCGVRNLLWRWDETTALLVHC